MNDGQKHNVFYLVFTGVFLLTGALLVPNTGHDFDIWCWTTWSSYIFENGLSNVYHSDTDYLPLFHYILAAYGRLQGSLENITDNIRYLKVVSLAFHCLSGFYILKLLQDAGMKWCKAFLMSLFFLLNIAILYNSVMWGQVDGIMTCLVFLSFYFAYKEKTTASLVLFVLAVNFKLQAIVFLPIIGLLLLPGIIQTFKRRQFPFWVPAVLFAQLIIITPFIISGTLPELWNVVTGSFGKYPNVAFGAYNFWELAIADDLHQLPDSNTFIGVSYNALGLAAFAITGFAALLPLMKNTKDRILGLTRSILTLEDLVAVTALIALLFFYFNTQMHERYSHPALIFLVVYGVLRRSPWLAVFGCLAYLLNLEAVFRAFGLNNYHTLVFEPVFISVLYLLVIVSLFSRKRGKMFVS